MLEEKEKLNGRMRAHGFDHFFTINPMTLSGTVKQLKANNDDQLYTWLEGAVKICEQPSIRAAESK